MIEHLGQGLQYSAFKFDSDRVFKWPNHVTDVVGIMQGWGGSFAGTFEEQTVRGQEMIDTTIATQRRFRDLLTCYPELSAHLGNPTFLENGAYEQDFTPTLSSVLRQCSEEEALGIFQSYAEGILLEWSYGFSDQVFNFTFNSSLNKQDEVVFIDFLEVTFDQNIALNVVDQQTWLHKQSYTYDLRPELQGIFAETMTKAITTDNLKRVWGSSLNS